MVQLLNKTKRDNMSKNINFRARSKTEFDVQTKPYPAVKQLPDWFTEALPYHNENGTFPDDNKLHFRKRNANVTFKKCVPLLDGMSAGYIIPLWSDVMVEQENNFPLIYWKNKVNVFEPHGDYSSKIVPPTGYKNYVFKYSNCWIPQTPKGYSCLVVSPLGYGDLPFKIVPAIVDTDNSTLELIFPTWVKEGFEGIVEKGTPMAQIIPFKRDNWESTFDYYEDGEYENVIEEKNFNSTMVGHYMKNHHSKKRFK
jgi:hypothetical protein